MNDQLVSASLPPADRSVKIDDPYQEALGSGLPPTLPPSKPAGDRILPGDSAPLPLGEGIEAGGGVQMPTPSHEAAVASHSSQPVS